METFRSPLRPGKETEMPKKLLMLQALSARDRDLTEDELTDIIAFYNENPVRSCFRVTAASTVAYTIAMPL